MANGGKREKGRERRSGGGQEVLHAGASRCRRVLSNHRLALAAGVHSISIGNVAWKHSSPRIPCIEVNAAGVSMAWCKMNLPLIPPRASRGRLIGPLVETLRGTAREIRVEPGEQASQDHVHMSLGIGRDGGRTYRSCQCCAPGPQTSRLESRRHRLLPVRDRG